MSFLLHIEDVPKKLALYIKLFFSFLFITIQLFFLVQYMKQKEQINEISSFPSDQHLYNNEEEEWKQVQQASTVARQSARDGAKVATFTVLFLFSFVNPIALLSGESTAFEGGIYRICIVIINCLSIYFGKKHSLNSQVTIRLSTESGQGREF